MMDFKVVVLPAPLRADQADDLALADFDRDILQHMAGAVPGIEVFHLQHRLSAPGGQDRPA